MQVYMQRMEKTYRTTPEALMGLKKEWGFDMDEIVPAHLYKFWSHLRRISPVQTEVHRLMMGRNACQQPVHEIVPAYFVFLEQSKSPWFTVISFNHEAFSGTCQNIRKLLGAKRMQPDFAAIPSTSEVERVWKLMIYQNRNVQTEECFDGPVSMAEVLAATPAPHELCAVEVLCERTLDQIPMTLYSLRISNPHYWSPEIMVHIDNTQFEKYMLIDHREREIVTALSHIADLVYDGKIQQACKP